MAYLLHNDVSVLMNDIDAMWVQDPYKSIFANHPDISIFAQRGAFPGIYKRKWGAAACMGFIYFRATEVINMYSMYMYPLGFPKIYPGVSAAL